MQTVDFVSDFRFTCLPDKRLDRRLRLISESLREDPSLSFPSAMTDSELEGAYRFIGNERVSLIDILSGHFKQTIKRAMDVGELLVLHDTTDINSASVDFRCHVSLGVDFKKRLPVGLLSVIPNPRGANEKKKPGSENENRRWLKGIVASERNLKHDPIHVADREAGSNEILHELCTTGKRFVIRGRATRRLADNAGLVSEVLSEGEIVATREIRLSKRNPLSGNPEDKKTHPARESRLAKLSITASQVKIQGVGLLNVVSVVERDAPEGETPVEWALFSTEPIATTEAILRIVDIYRARWLIEEFFKALKTGCQYEKRQLESYEAMLATFGILAPMALQMLLLRTLARDEADRPASDALSPVQLSILKALPRTAKYPQRTVREALLAIAGLGGHLKNNGEPGWITLGRGFEKLQNYEVGWELAGNARLKM